VNPALEGLRHAAKSVPAASGKHQLARTRISSHAGKPR
jgi:hypothetical protein